jgi:hypothetical protein
MKPFLCLAALGLAFPVLTARPQGAVPADVGQQVPQFTAEASSLLDSHDNQVLTAYMIVGVKCGATPRYAERLKALETEFRSKGVEFVYLYPNKTESRDEKLAFHRKIGLRSAWVDDEGAKICKALGFTNTAATVLVDEQGQVVYRGGIDDSADAASVKRRHLAEAINETLADKPVSITTSKPFG